MKNLSLRQVIEGMTLSFDPVAANGLTAVLQFEIGEPEPGVYHLRIAHGQCTFHRGASDSPTLTITSPPDVWLKISNGEITGQEALMQGLYQAQGELGLLPQMNRLFKPRTQICVEAKPGQRPAGPMPLAGMTWMAIAFIPWMIYWVAFHVPEVSQWVSIGLPLLLSAMIVSYRITFNKTTWLEIGSLGFFALAALLIWLGSAWFAVWGSIFSSLVIGALWLTTVIAAAPLSVEYAKWKYIEALWRTSMFIYPNALISLVWGWQFVISALVGIAATRLPEFDGLLTAARYLLLVPTFIFTSIYQKRAPYLRLDDFEQAMARLRLCAWAGLAASLGLCLMTLALGSSPELR